MRICASQMHQVDKVGVSPSRPVSGVVARQVATERVLAELDRLAPLPTVVMEVMQAAEDPHATFSDLEQIICRDLVVMGRVFKLANSAFYARGEPLKTMGEALRRLGFTTIKTLVMAAGAGKILTQSLQHYAYSPFGFWKHSLGLALVARLLARHLGFPVHLQDELFLAGLLHDIGKLVLDPILGEVGGISGRVTPDMELVAIGFDHSEIGYRIAKKWKLPDHVTAVIAHHHALQVNADFTQHAALIHLGDYLINDAGVGLSEPAEVEEGLDPAALAILCLEAQTIETIREVVSDALPTIIELCEELGQC